MPDCPLCHVTIALSNIGPICPECRKHYSPMEIHALPDYHFQETYRHMMAFLQLMDAGFVNDQLYHIGLLDDGIAVLPLGVYPK